MIANAEEIRDLAAPHVSSTGGVITALRAIQTAYRHVPEEADAIVADVFNLSRAEIRGIVSFYADFCRLPRAKTVVRICDAEACQAAGGATVRREIESAFASGEETPDEVSLESVYCLGLCSVAPAVMIEEELIGRADAERVRTSVEKHKRVGAS